MSEAHTDKKLLALLARPNWRGVETSSLVYTIQDARHNLAMLGIDPLSTIGIGPPDGCSEAEYIESHRYYQQQIIKGLEEEIERRRQIKYEGVLHTNAEIIQTIKAALPIEDVLEWYTDVFLNKRQWTYRCTLHGADVHPSGVIYREEKRCWCFVCQKGGDVFDVVQLFERVDLPRAIAKLARHLGLDVKPLVRPKQNYRDVTV